MSPISQPLIIKPNANFHHWQNTAPESKTLSANPSVNRLKNSSDSVSFGSRSQDINHSFIRSVYANIRRRPEIYDEAALDPKNTFTHRTMGLGAQLALSRLVNDRPGAVFVMGHPISVRVEAIRTRWMYKNTVDFEIDSVKESGHTVSRIKLKPGQAKEDPTHKTISQIYPEAPAEACFNSGFFASAFTTAVLKLVSNRDMEKVYILCQAKQLKSGISSIKQQSALFAIFGYKFETESLKVPGSESKQSVVRIEKKLRNWSVPLF